MGGGVRPARGSIGDRSTTGMPLRAADGRRRLGATAALGLTAAHGLTAALGATAALGVSS
ncbi:hypothetical protein DBR36_04000 [Microbacterium sp. HMWF026]|uniref:hypothetical protein n=1 Tax=Microbacterium sp. HMWF026 TaxID=2056861 RepID=UPI000D336768|nr:hypothetical protein [Microbacterium sp. HMWF026]PTT21421.1 hypothetical protein DBR36_04000 [Microbacterium sp. HMWF026]